MWLDHRSQLKIHGFSEEAAQSQNLETQTP
jgi:hypothetical protein